MTHAPWLKEHQFRKGVSGNPHGRHKIPESLKAIRAISQEEVCRLISKYARMNRDELQIAIQDKQLAMIDLTIASIFAQSAKNGDYQRLGFLLDRAIGKAPIVGNMNDDNHNELLDLSREELLRLVKEKLPELEAG